MSFFDYLAYLWNSGVVLAVLVALFFCCVTVLIAVAFQTWGIHVRDHNRSRAWFFLIVPLAIIAISLSLAFNVWMVYEVVL